MCHSIKRYTLIKIGRNIWYGTVYYIIAANFALFHQFHHRNTSCKYNLQISLNNPYIILPGIYYGFHCSVHFIRNNITFYNRILWSLIPQYIFKSTKNHLWSINKNRLIDFWWKHLIMMYNIRKYYSYITCFHVIQLLSYTKL